MLLATYYSLLTSPRIVCPPARTANYLHFQGEMVIAPYTYSYSYSYTYTYTYTYKARW